MAINLCVGCELSFLNLICSFESQKSCLSSFFFFYFYFFAWDHTCKCRGFSISEKFLNVEYNFLLITCRKPASLGFWSIVFVRIFCSYHESCFSAFHVDTPYNVLCLHTGPLKGPSVFSLLGSSLLSRACKHLSPEDISLLITSGASL